MYRWGLLLSRRPYTRAPVSSALPVIGIELPNTLRLRDDPIPLIGKVIIHFFKSCSTSLRVEKVKGGHGSDTSSKPDEVELPAKVGNTSRTHSMQFDYAIQKASREQHSPIGANDVTCDPPSLFRT